MRHDHSADMPDNYVYEFDPEGDNAPAFILGMVQPNSKVLELGAGPGMIAKELKPQKNCAVTALDIEPKYVSRLAEFCDAAHVADLNNNNWMDVLKSEEKFDVVIAADILEHLVDPWTTLRQIRTVVKEDGDIIISLPHVGHCVVISCLINSDFEYQDRGLLDRTHLRFFGLKNMQSLINDAGLDIVDAKFVLQWPDSIELASQWSKLPESLKDTLLNGAHSKIYQVVVRAKAKGGTNTSLTLEQLNIGEPYKGLLMRVIPFRPLRAVVKNTVDVLLPETFKRAISRFLRKLLKKA